MKDKKNLTILGFQCHRLLSECMRKEIPVKEIKYIDDTEISFTIDENQCPKLEKIAGNKYKISTNKVFGPKTTRKKILRRKGILVGIAIFFALLYYQSLFISEILVTGCETVTPEKVKEVLMDAGIYQGGKVKEFDIKGAKDLLYSQIPEIVWNEIEVKGNLVSVSIIEKIDVSPNLSLNTPCDVISKKAGILEKVNTKHGLAVKESGDYVNIGDVVISGTLLDKTGENVRYVHSLGDVYARIPYVFTYYESKKENVLKETGKNIYGVELKFGDFHFNTTKIMNRYEKSVEKKNDIIHANVPIPMGFNMVNCKEVTVSQRDRTKQEIEKSIQNKLLKDLKKNIAKDGKIVKKDLKFHDEGNTLKTTVILEVLEQVGTEEKIMPMD